MTAMWLSLVCNHWTLVNISNALCNQVAVEQLAVKRQIKKREVSKQIPRMRHLCPRLCARPLCRLRARLLCGLLQQGPWRLPLVQHPAHGGDCSTSDGSRFALPAGAPVGVVGAQTAALLPAARWCDAQYGASDFSAGHRAEPICQLSSVLTIGLPRSSHWWATASAAMRNSKPVAREPTLTEGLHLFHCSVFICTRIEPVAWPYQATPNLQWS
jgi:hypothetical protein